MGNSRWWHVVPYQENLSWALHDLQSFIFSIGRFYKGYSYTDDEWPSSLKELRQRSHGETHSVLDIDYVVDLPPHRPDQQPLFPEPESTSMRQPLLFGSHGTILLDQKYLDQPEAPPGSVVVRGFGIYPLSQNELLRVFGTERPTWYQAEVAEEMGDLDRLGCIYVLLFDDGTERPTHILFCGWSGGGP